MLIDGLGCPPTAPFPALLRFIPVPRVHRPFVVFALFMLLFPMMTDSIDPVPSSSWLRSIDPSYVSPSEFGTVDDVDAGSGQGLVVASSHSNVGQFEWRTGQRAHLKQNMSIVDGRGDGHDDKLVGHGQQDTDTGVLPEAPPADAVVRWYQLYNRCSGRYLQMYMNEVNARGKYGSPLAQLRVITDSYGSRIRIQSQKFNKYLCFNRRQRITSKYNGRSDRCVFVERISDNHYTELESAWRPGLYLGFNRGDGRFLDPARYYIDRRICFQFIKTSNSTTDDTFTIGQQQQNDGPTDFGRMGELWRRTKMQQGKEVYGHGQGGAHRKRHQHRRHHEHPKWRGGPH